MTSEDKPDDRKIISLTDRARQTLDGWLPTLERQIDDSSHERFVVQLAEIIRSWQSWPPETAIVAGSLGVGQSDLSRVPLPESYRAAVAALRACDRVDEAATMAHKAEALAIYARQATDKQLLFFARRIQARACRRCGELLREYRGQVGRRKIVEGALPNSPQTRASAATQAGLSEHQRKTVLRLAAIPEADFEDAVEGPSPPTVTALATQGVWRTRRRPPPSSVIDATTDLIVDFSYPRDLSLSEIATERQLAVLMHAWRSAENEARRRFLDLLGLTATQIADFAT